MGKHPIASSLNHSVRILLAGTLAYRPRHIYTMAHNPLLLCSNSYFVSSVVLLRHNSTSEACCPEACCPRATFVSVVVAVVDCGNGDGVGVVVVVVVVVNVLLIRTTTMALSPRPCAAAAIFAETGGAAYGGYVLGKYDIGRRGAEGYHSGGTRLVLMIVCIVSALIVYDTLACIVLAFLRKGSTFSSVQVSSCCFLFVRLVAAFTQLPVRHKLWLSGSTQRE